MSISLALTAASLSAASPAFAEPPVLTLRSGDAPALAHRRHGRRDGGWRDGKRRGRSQWNGPAFYYDREYQGDSAWRSDSFNDWWHEDTGRSYPRWLRNNANCERQYYAGDTLRC